MRSEAPVLEPASIAIVADDLTSALDHAVGFANAGYRARVVLEGEALASASGAEVIAFDADTRACDPSVAATRTAKAIHALRDADILIKTIDSTLRGNVAAELAAACVAGARSAVVVAPAFPRYGRRTIDGVQQLDGIPVHLGPAGSDPIAPAKTSNLRELLEPTFDGITVVSSADLSALEAGLSRHGTVIIDAAEDVDLDDLVRAVRDPRAVLWAGSTGLSQAIARVFPARPAGVAPRRPARRVGVVIGSVNPTTREQLARTAETMAAAVEIKWDRAGWTPPSATRVVIASPATVTGELGRDGAREISRRLGGAALACVEDGVEGLVLSGGDTAVATIRALGATGITVVGEIEPGIALAILEGPHPLPIVTKAGGFGSPDALTQSILSLEKGA